MKMAFGNKKKITAYTPNIPIVIFWLKTSRNTEEKFVPYDGYVKTTIPDALKSNTPTNFANVILPISYFY